MSCDFNPCHKLCPELMLPTTYKCSDCGDQIMEDEQFYSIEGHYYHEDCLATMPFEELMCLLDIHLVNYAGY